MMNTNVPVSPILGTHFPELKYCPKTQGLIDALVSKTKAPRDLVLMQVLASYSILLQGLIDVGRPGAGRGPTSLYTLTIAESGERKTTVANLLEKPINDFQQFEEERYQDKLAEYEMEMEIYEEQISQLRRRISKAIKAEV